MASPVPVNTLWSVVRHHLPRYLAPMLYIQCRQLHRHHCQQQQSNLALNPHPMPTPNMSAIPLLAFMSDHRKMENLFTKIRAQNEVPKKIEALRELIGCMEAHNGKEEASLYPFFSSYCGERSLRQIMLEHDEQQHLINFLKTAQDTFPAREVLKLEKRFKDHMEHEEHVLFPKLQDRISVLDALKVNELLFDYDTK